MLWIIYKYTLQEKNQKEKRRENRGVREGWTNRIDKEEMKIIQRKNEIVKISRQT